MSNRLYVGNLPYTITATELQQVFAEFGTVVSAHVISDRETGRSRGFGFVEMDSPEAFRNALERANGRDVGGRQLSVTEARERPPGGPRPSPGGYGGPRPGGSRERSGFTRPDRPSGGGGWGGGAGPERGGGRDEGRRRKPGRERPDKRRVEAEDRPRRSRFKDFPGDDDFG